MKEREEGHSLADTICPIRDRREITVNSPDHQDITPQSSTNGQGKLGSTSPREHTYESSFPCWAETDRWPETPFQARVFLDHASGYVLLERNHDRPRWAGAYAWPVEWKAIQLIEAARHCVIAGDRCCQAHQRS